MTSQADGGHHSPLSRPDLVNHMDDMHACFQPDPDDTIFFEIIYSTCLSVFPITFHFVQITLNRPPRM